MPDPRRFVGWLQGVWPRTLQPRAGWDERHDIFDEACAMLAFADWPGKLPDSFSHH